MSRTPLRPTLAPLAAGFVVLLFTLVPAGEASALDTSALDTSALDTSGSNASGFVRLGNLAPQEGPLEVYLAPFGGETPSAVTKANYGSITPRQRVAPGAYTLAVRVAGAPATTPPLLSAQLTVARDASYTVLVSEKAGKLITSVLDDDVSPSPTTSSRIRLVQGASAAQSLTVEAVDGPTLARRLVYGTATGYATVPSGRWLLKVTADDNRPTSDSRPTSDGATAVDLAAGSTYSVVVTNGRDGGFAVDPVADTEKVAPAAADTVVVPTGGVETGGGGATSRDRRDCSSPRLARFAVPIPRTIAHRPHAAVRA